MNMAQHRFAAARASYGQVGLSSRVEGASPHQLIAVLFDELLKSLEMMAAAAARRDLSLVGSSQSRALSVLNGLQSSLDMERGGEVALLLASVYAECRRLTLQAGRDCDAEGVQKVRDTVAEIAGAWQAIG